jgi:hypothetical protein
MTLYTYSNLFASEFGFKPVVRTAAAATHIDKTL